VRTVDFVIAVTHRLVTSLWTRPKISGKPTARRTGRAWLGAARARGAAVSRRGREWADRQDPGSPTGVAIGAWRRYQAVDGPLQSALLSLYILVAIVPGLARDGGVPRLPSGALADRLIRH
jgi:hypothetical protein